MGAFAAGVGTYGGMPHFRTRPSRECRVREGIWGWAGGSSCAELKTDSCRKRSSPADGNDERQREISSTTKSLNPGPMADELRLVHALAPARVGGLESVVSALAAGLTDRGHDVRVLAVLDTNAAGHDFVRMVEAKDVPVRRVEVSHRAYCREFARIRKLLERIAPDVLHTHGYRADVVAASAARRLGVPSVSTVHGFTGGGWKNRFYEWLQRRSLRRHDAVLAVSEPIREALVRSGVDGDRVRLVRNAWVSGTSLLGREEVRDRLELPERAFVAGWVGRLSREKGPDVFLNAMAALAGEGSGSEAIAAIVGDGGQRASLEAKTQRLGLEGAVHFHGRVREAARLYRAFDCFVLSSRTEGTPVSLLEAMEAEVPVVATAVGGVPDVVRDGREALLVPPEDPSALARALEAVRRNREAARERARRARERLETEFAPQPWLDRHESVYRKVVGEE